MLAGNRSSKIIFCRRQDAIEGDVTATTEELKEERASLRISQRNGLLLSQDWRGYRGPGSYQDLSMNGGGVCRVYAREGSGEIRPDAQR